MINVRDYGCTGNGAADDTAAIRHAFEHSDGLVHFPAGTYKVTAPLAVPRNTHIAGDGVDATVITAQGAPVEQFPGYRAVFQFTGGGFAPLAGVAADIRRFDVHLPLQSTESIQPNDVLALVDPTPKSYSGFVSWYHAGEFVHVNELADKRVRLMGSLQADYPKDKVMLFRMERPTRSSIARMTVIGPDRTGGNNLCLRFQGGRGVGVRDVRLTGAHYALCQFVQCFGAQAENVEAEQIFPFASKNNLNYGIAVTNCQDVRIVNCRITAMRHAVTIGGMPFAKDNPSPVNRQISVVNCDLKGSCDMQALDAHGNTEFYAFESNRIAGGIDFAGHHGRIINNDIYGRDETQAGIALYANDWKGTEFEIRGNRIRTKTTESYSGRGAVFLMIDKETVLGGPTIIRDNSIHVTGSIGDCRGIRLLNRGSAARWIVIIDNNDFHAATAGRHIVVEKRPSTLAPLEALLVRNNTFRNGDVVIKADDVRQLVFKGNWPLADR